MVSAGINHWCFQAGSWTESIPLITELLSWEPMRDVNDTHIQANVLIAFIWERFLSLLYLLPSWLCSQPLSRGLRSHYVVLISVVDSGGSVRDCRGRREERERRNEAYGCESEHTTPNCTDRA